MDEKCSEASACPYCTLCSGAAAAFVRQNAGSKRRDSGTFTCQMVGPPLLLPCHRAATGGSLEAETYAFQRVWPAVQLVALEPLESGKTHADTRL